MPRPFRYYSFFWPIVAFRCYRDAGLVSSGEEKKWEKKGLAGNMSTCRHGLTSSSWQLAAGRNIAVPGSTGLKASMPAAYSILPATGCETASAEILACSCTDMRKDCASRATAGTFAPPPYVARIASQNHRGRAQLCSVLCTA